MKKLFYLLLLSFFIGFVACSDDPDYIPEPEGEFANGTFILNEGSVFQENSKLTFISPNGVVTDSAYWKANGTELGNASQDLFIANGKIYFISQNGKSNIGTYDSDGMLIIADAGTLKKQAAYNDEVSVLNMPTHLAVLNDNNVFIRDNKGVYLFNPSTKEIQFIEGSEDARKNRMVVAGGKVFVPTKNKTVLVLEAGKTTVSHTIDMQVSVSSVIKSSDGNIFVATTASPNKVVKINTYDYSVIKEVEITAGSVGEGYGATPGIAAKGDCIYYNGGGTSIYRLTFSTGVCELLAKVGNYVENVGMAYNNIAVNPATGYVYMTTIKGYGNNFLINNISIFDFSKAEPALKENYENYTHFPAGTFFTYDFR